ncbi:GtrA family protein [Paractinoplanes ferrugineus]|uniref:GtrA family protein n=1 Tax=Paractinoplanes ferrugineus TaxID=113564 RepID=UPI0031D359CA
MPGNVDLFRVHRGRILRFALVGGFCFVVQYAVMIGLRRIGIDLSVANAVGFAVSAQLNFVLSSVFTWGGGARLSWLRWASYNSTALLGLAVNTVVFSTVHSAVGVPLAAVLGVGSGAVFTYLVCNFLIFKVRRVPVAEAEIPA